MRLRILLLSSVAALALMHGAPKPAAAQQLGFYAQATGGVVWLEDRGVATDSFDGEFGHADFSRGWAGGLRFGIVPADHFRLELEGTYRTNDGRLTGTGEGIDISAFALMLNGYYDFDLGGPITPYVGLGAGVLAVHQGGGGFDPLGGSEDDVVPALQGRIGAAYVIDQHWSITLDYTYLRGFGVDTPGGGEDDYISESIMAGIRFTFP